jgi:hypothetical protein
VNLHSLINEREHGLVDAHVGLNAAHNERLNIERIYLRLEMGVFGRGKLKFFRDLKKFKELSNRVNGTPQTGRILFRHEYGHFKHLERQHAPRDIFDKFVKTGYGFPEFFLHVDNKQRRVIPRQQMRMFHETNLSLSYPLPGQQISPSNLSNDNKISFKNQEGLS